MLRAKQYLGAEVIAVIAFLLLSATFSFATETITNTYDELNRLTKSVFGTRFMLEYSYDDFGNRSQKKITILDTSAPQTTILTEPGNPSKSASAIFTFTSETNASFDCQLDSGAWSECNSGSMSYSGLADGSHTFNVKATDRSGNTDATPAGYTWIVDTTPLAPTNLTSTVISSTQITLNWSDNADDETGFKIERSGTSNGPYVQIATTAENVTTFTDSGLAYNTPYFYRITAFNASGNSAYSNEISATILSFTITASAGANGSITPSGSIIVMNHANQAFIIAPAAGYHTTDVSVDGTSIGVVTTYTFSNVTSNHTINVLFIMDLPSAPTNLQAQMVASDQVNLNWADNSSNEAGFKIERKAGAGSYQQIAAVGPNVNVYSDSGLTPNTYTYRVRAYNDGGNSAYSNEATVIVQTYTISASAGANGSISPVGAVRVFSGAAQSFTVSPAAGYAVADVIVDGVSLGERPSYTFSNITTDHAISVSFCKLNQYYRDFDQDGYGNTNLLLQSCIPTSGYVTDNMDCNDNNKKAHPDAIEICNNKDDNCDDQIDNSCIGGIEMGLVGHFMPVGNWLVRVYTEGAAGSYSVYLEIRDTNNVLVPGASIAGLSDNPYLITYDATMPDVVLYFDEGSNTAYIFYTMASGMTLTNIPGLAPTP